MPVFIDKSGAPETSGPVVYSGAFTAEMSSSLGWMAKWVEVAL